MCWRHWIRRRGPPRAPPQTLPDLIGEADADGRDTGIAAIEVVAEAVHRTEPVAVQLQLESAVHIPVRVDRNGHHAADAQITELGAVASAELVVILGAPSELDLEYHRHATRRHPG